MQTYKIISLVDITRSKPDRTCTDRIILGQQSNFNSLLQAIGLRANPEWTEDPVMETGRLPEPFDGKANYWIWNFNVERDMVWERNGDTVSLLLEDLHGVPVIDRLNNTVLLSPCAFQTKGKEKNIWVSKIS